MENRTLPLMELPNKKIKLNANCRYHEKKYNELNKNNPIQSKMHHLLNLT